MALFRETHREARLEFAIVPLENGQERAMKVTGFHKLAATEFVSSTLIINSEINN